MSGGTDCPLQFPVSTCTCGHSTAQGTDPCLAQMREKFIKLVAACDRELNPSLTCTLAFLFIVVWLETKLPRIPVSGRPAQST